VLGILVVIMLSTAQFQPQYSSIELTWSFPQSDMDLSEPYKKTLELESSAWNSQVN
jgi:hypothetical protein